MTDRLPTGARNLVLVGLLAAAIVGTSAWFLLPNRSDATLSGQCAAVPGPDETETGDSTDMIPIPGGRFTMGSENFHTEEMPVHSVEVDPFMIDRYEVTNAQFAAFVDATGYVTLAERALDPADFPGVAPALLVPGAAVFVAPDSVTDMIDIGQWWRYVEGASWRHPEGPGSSIEGRETHPVVHVTREDALAYAQWLGRDLPTEAEWEFAARGGLESADYIWGNEAVPDGHWQANAWQGVFPVIDQVTDGYAGTAPAGCYAPNGYGLYDMAGNVWEIVRDDYADSRGAQPGMGVIKGGSFLCADNFCLRYRPAARQAAALDTGTSHIGFRTVLRADGSIAQ